MPAISIVTVTPPLFILSPDRTMALSDWLVWQLADSAFPSGGFAHSGGLEAAWQWGEVRDRETLVEYVRASITQLGHGGLPLVRAAHREAALFGELDALCDAFLSNHVANRASRRQGQALLATAVSVYPIDPLRQLRILVAENGGAGHLATVFGRVTGLLGLESERAARLFLFVALRGLLSSAVRLGATGPLEAQGIQFEVSEFCEGVVRKSRACNVEQLAQTAPMIEILQANHDRLYSRLFQS